MIDGRRITDAPMLDLVVMIYAGKSTKCCAQLQAYTNAIGFSGADGNLIQSEKETIPQSTTDL
jgi:acetylglutamate kinase